MFCCYILVEIVFKQRPQKHFFILGTQPHLKTPIYFSPLVLLKGGEGQTPGLLGKQRRLLNEVTKQKDVLNPVLQCCKGAAGKGREWGRSREKGLSPSLAGGCPALGGAFSPGLRPASLQSLAKSGSPPSVRAATLRDSAASRRLAGDRKARSRSVAPRGGAQQGAGFIQSWSKRRNIRHSNATLQGGCKTSGRSSPREDGVYSGVRMCVSPEANS